MRIAFLAGDVASIGSARSITLPLAKALARAGHDVLCVSTVRGMGRMDSIDGVPVRFVSVLPELARNPWPAVRQRYAASRISRTNNQHSQLWPQDYASIAGYDALVGQAFRRGIHDFSADVVYAFMGLNVFRLMAAGPPLSQLVIINLVGFGIDTDRGGPVDTFPLQRLIFHNPNWHLHVTATEFEHAQYSRVYESVGMDTSKLLLQPHCIDEDAFFPDHSREEDCLWSSEWDSYLVYPVQVYPRKNVEFALEVLHQIQDFGRIGLVITGKIWNRHYYERLMTRARQLGVSSLVRFLDGVTPDRLRRILSGAHATIFPSHQETFGLGMIESLICGTQVVGPDWIRPCAQILQGLPGTALGPKDPSRFTEVLRETLSISSDRLEIARAASREYGSTRIAARFIDRVEKSHNEVLGYREKVNGINWRELYDDEGDLGLAAQTSCCRNARVVDDELATGKRTDRE